MANLIDKLFNKKDETITETMTQVCNENGCNIEETKEQIQEDALACDENGCSVELNTDDTIESNCENGVCGIDIIDGTNEESDNTSEDFAEQNDVLSERDIRDVIREILDNYPSTDFEVLRLKNEILDIL